MRGKTARLLDLLYSNECTRGGGHIVADNQAIWMSEREEAVK